MSSSSDNQITPFDGYGADAPDPGQIGALARVGPGGGNGLGPVTSGGQAMGIGGAADLPAGAPPGMAARVHTALRGRYWIAIVLVVICGGTGVYFGYRSQIPVYRGEAMIQIAYNIGPAMVNTGNNGVMANYEEYLQSQAMMMTSQTIINKAIKGKHWGDTRLGTADGVASVVAKNLTVEHPSRTELIRVYYVHPDKDVAKAVVYAIVKAYEDYASQRSSESESKRIRTLDDRKALLAGQVARVDAQILDAANRFGTPNLEAIVEAKLNEETSLEKRKNELELALDAAKRKKSAKETVVDLTENQIAMIDPVMRGMLMERETALNMIARLEATGHLPNNSKLKEHIVIRDQIQKKIERYAVEWRDLQMRLADDPSLAGMGIGRVAGLSDKVLAGEFDSVRRKFEQVKEERTEIGRHMLKIQDLQRQREEKFKEHMEVSRRIDVLTMENMASGRLSVPQEGDVPMTPFKDRRKLMGLAGAMGGFGIPVVFLVLIGLLDRRYRFSDEAKVGGGMSNVPLLGILPRLPDKLTDPEQAAVAAHCIHQIRIMLQVGSNPENRRVFMITSASTGDGKTSLTMALGLSFAASGSKTLVVDCDMVGQGLTHRLKAHNVPGLIETLHLGTLRGHVRKTATKGLYVLPIGSADAVHAGILSPQSIKRLLTACREHFDIIIIDTGPVLGSLEASVVAAEADGVIMAVARGQQQPLVDKAIKHTRSIGANLMGIVFNRAEDRDFQRSVPSASIRSTSSAKPAEAMVLLPDNDESARFGPLARSVASSLPSNNPSHGGA